MSKKKFATTALDTEHETYVIYIGSISSVVLFSSFPPNTDIHPFRKPQISSLIAEEAFTKVPAKYSDFTDIFSPDLVSKVLKYSGINNYAIKLVDCQQLPYEPIYSLKSVELKTLKAYIETNLANGFIRLSKLPATAPILFDQKSNGSF